MNAVLELSNSTELTPRNKMQRVVETMKNEALPLDFWDEFKLEVGKTDELYKNHELLEELT